MKNELFEEFCTDRNLSEGSKKTYKTAIKDYTNFNNLTIEELINEADEEEEQRIRSKNRKISKRLKQYQNHKIKQKASYNTINSLFVKIRTFYRHFGIEIPYIPPANIKKEHHERYSDIPTIKHIKQVINSISNKKHKAIILFMSSSGTAANETINLTVKDFFKATEKYHDNNTDIDEILYQLNNQNDIVPLFDIIRLKTNYPYYTCCSPEATKAIVEYLMFEDELTLNRKLFNISRYGLVSFFKRINKNNNFGSINNRSFFHSHALRKFHATAIEDTGLANTLQGRKADSITEAYFKKDPERIKKKYIEHLPKLTINKTVVNQLDDEGYKKLKNMEDEMVKLRNENEEFKELIRDKLNL